MMRIFQYMHQQRASAAAGAVLLTVATGPSPHSLFLFLIVAQTVFGFGVGGEFPVAASSASERAESSEKLKSLRGQTVVLVFSMVSSHPVSSPTHANMIIQMQSTLMGLKWWLHYNDERPSLGQDSRLAKLVMRLQRLARYHQKLADLKISSPRNVCFCRAFTSRSQRD